MNILGIETSCDETAAAVVKDGRTVLSNVVYTQIPLHVPYGGVVPEIASRAHVEKISEVDVEGVKPMTHAHSRVNAWREDEVKPSMDREAALAKYDRVLSNLSARIDGAMRSGLAPDEYPKVEALKEANVLARKILRLTARVGGEARKA